MREEARITEPCSDCKSLKEGMRSMPGPHQYLVLLGPSSANPAASAYRCLICQSKLVYELHENKPVWR